MSGLSTGGGSSAVAASAHAGCERFRYTDPLVIGMTRRALAARLGHPDTSAGIPEARWMRAMTFESLVRHERFVSELLTTTVGRLSLVRPEAVRRANGRVSVDATATALQQAHLKSVHEGVATMVTNLAVPFVGMEDVAGATPVKPDFAIVAPRHRLGADGTVRLGGGIGAGRCAAPQSRFTGFAWPGHHRVRHRGAEARTAAAHPLQRGLVVSGLFGTAGRI